MTYYATVDESIGPAKALFMVRRMAYFPIFLITKRPRIVHVHCSAPYSALRKCFYMLTARIMGRTVIAHIHPNSFDDRLSDRGRLFERIAYFAIGRANFIITLTESMRRRLMRRFGEAKLCVLRNPVWCSDYTRSTSRGGGKDILLYLGWIVESKGIFDLVDAVALVRITHPHVVLYCCGPKEVRRLRDYVKEKDLQDNVIVKDWVDYEEKVVLLGRSLALILPSYTEGIPNVILEAMAAGAVIITTPVGGIPEVLHGEENAIYVSPGDVNGLAGAICRVLDSPGSFEDIRRRNREKAVSEFDISVISERLSRIYDGLTGPLPASPVREHGVKGSFQKMV